MARTAPAPNIPPIPGMCPSIAVLAGGGDGGGDSGGSAGDGKGDDKAGTSNGGESAAADKRGAPDPQKYPDCGTASHPVDVVTGRAFTHPLTDLELPGPLPLVFQRTYSSKMAGRDCGLGFGWGHTFGWEIEVGRRRITVWNEQGVGVDFPTIAVGSEIVGPWGWLLRRETWGFAVDADDGVWHLFSAVEDDGKRVRLTAIEDRNRNRIALTYDDGRLVEVTDSTGRVVRLVPTREGRIGSIRVQNAVSQGQWVAFATYTYDERGDLVAATDADGLTARYAYDDDHRLTADTDRAGLCFHFVYDSQGRCVESWGDYPGKRDPSLVETVPKYLHDGKTRAKGIHHCKFEYGPDGYSEVVDSTQVRRFFGTRHGTLSKRVEGGGVTTALYRDDGHLLARTDAMGGTTHFERDARGRALRVTDALGNVTLVERDAAGLVIQAVDAVGAVSAMTRDTRGNVLTHTDALGGVTSYRYDERGLATEVVDPRGGRTALAYDERGNCAELTAPGGATWRYTHDALGRRLSETDPLGGTKRFAYSARGDLISARDALGGEVRYTYDGERHVVQIVGRASGVTELVWGGYHKLCARKDANGSEVRLRYNLEGELLEVHNARGEVHRFERSAGGAVTGESTFDGQTVRYRNDAAGRHRVVTDGLGQQTKLEFDLAGQLVARELADGAVETFAYDAQGQLVAAHGGACEVRFGWDALGRLVREAQVVDDEEHSVDITYDATGNRVLRETSWGHTEAVERDALGMRRRTILDAAHVLEHALDALGREVRRALPGGGAIESAYDPAGRLVQRRAQGPSVHRPTGSGEPEWLGPRADHFTASLAYRYDPTGELIEEWDRRRGHTSYQYDAVGQLLAASPEHGPGEAFRYDPDGNAHETGAGAPPRAYQRGGRLLRKGDATYRWDDGGRLVEKRVTPADGAPPQVWTYRWNGAGLMQSASGPDGVLVELTYDALGRRVQKRVSRPSRPGDRPTPVSVTRFVWDGDVLAHELTRVARRGGDPVVETRTYCFDDDTFAPVAHRDARRDAEGQGSARWFHYVNDPLGTPDRLVSDEGRVACELSPGAWGRAPLDAGETRTPLRFPGQYHDDETGLCYNRHRYYDPDTGHFTSADPIGLRGGVHAFRYAPNTRRWQDPLGLARFGDKVFGGRRTPEQDAIIKKAEAHESRACQEAKASGGTATPVPAAEADAMIREANAHKVPVRAKTNDITGDHGFGPVAPTPHVHINGAHVVVPPGYTPPSGSTVITDTGPTTMP